MTDSPCTDVTGYVLAGGQSRRMGQDKALLEVDGTPLIEHALETLQAVCAQAKILSGPPDGDRDALLSCYARLVPDAERTYAGPLAGLAAALADCPTPYALLLPIDQPAITAQALRSLLAARTTGAAAIHLQNGERAEPLPLLASRDLLPFVETALCNGERRLLPTIRAAAAHIGKALQAVIPSKPAHTEAWFRNLNTPDDLREWLEAGQTSNQSAARASERGHGR